VVWSAKGAGVCFDPGAQVIGVKISRRRRHGKISYKKKEGTEYALDALRGKVI
jgi:hypothetical protein